MNRDEKYGMNKDGETRFMRTKLFFLVVLVCITALIVGMSGCSWSTPPSDMEILKAIDESGVLKGKGFTVTSPVVVVEKGKRNKDGSWPVKVKMTMTMQLPNGKVSEPRDNMPIFRIFKTTDSAGRSVWKATLGS
jgi:hypothetical protein